MKKQKSLDFEESLKKLNSIVEKMEQGHLSLEAALQQFEEGISLIHSCQKALSEAEQKVKILIEKHGKPTLENFKTDE